MLRRLCSDTVVPGRSATVSPSGEYECDTDDRFEIPIPDRGAGAFKSVATFTLRAGLNPFSIVMPANTPSTVMRVIPFDQAGAIRLRKLDMMVERE